jgi:16S rRNA (cytidine1402-2'-O)-methyltransferase
VLRSATRIACEDTRQTQKLLNHYGITTPTVSCHAHNEAARAAELVAELTAGARIAVVSDAGTPGISDPGMFLTRAAIAAGIPVYPIPGASALLSALVASGLSTERFLFLGFLPEKAGARRSELESLARATTEPLTLVAYEAPHRILDTLADITAVWGGAQVVVARELTKIHEEFLRGPAAAVAADLAARDRVRGEMVLLLEAGPLATDAPRTQTLAARVAALMNEQVPEMDALKRAAREHGLSKSEAYREWQRAKK